MVHLNSPPVIDYLRAPNVFYGWSFFGPLRPPFGSKSYKRGICNPCSHQYQQKQWYEVVLGGANFQKS